MKGTHDADLSTVFASLRSLLDHGYSLGMNLLDSALSFELPSSMAKLPQTMLDPKHWKHSGCDCHIPPPCWMPVDLGCLTSHPCHGGTATLGIHIINKSLATRTFHLSHGSGGAGITFTPATLTLGPMESGWVRVSSAPAPHGDCDDDGASVR
jgi:hypothetical protein